MLFDASKSEQNTKYVVGKHKHKQTSANLGGNLNYFSKIMTRKRTWYKQGDHNNVTK